MGQTAMSEEIRKIIFDQLPEIIKTHPEVKITLKKMLADDYAPKQQTEDRFEMLLEKMRIQEEKSDRRHEAFDKKFEEMLKKLDENAKEHKEFFKRFEENDRKFERMMEKIGNVEKRIDRTIGALGARWGLFTEETFRKAISSVLESFTDTIVERYVGYDRDGYVFGHPDQVEIDVVVRNGKLWVMEIKSSASKADVYIFNRKVDFYQKEMGKTADKRAIISPMVDNDAKLVAEKLGIEVYTAPEDMA